MYMGDKPLGDFSAAAAHTNLLQQVFGRYYRCILFFIFLDGIVNMENFPYYSGQRCINQRGFCIFCWG